MKKLLFIFFTIFICQSAFSIQKVKDLVTVKGVRENPLIGYGLIIGLQGTGDGGGEVTNNSLKRMLQKLGLNPQREIASKNVAAVIVTSKLPQFARVGQKVDVTISSIGDASSLAGGTLLITPLKGGDGEIYMVANGPVSVGGVKGGKFGTTALVPQGGIIEKEIPTDFHRKKSIRLSLIDPDFTTAARLEKVINKNLGGKFASAKDSTTVDLLVPSFYERKVVELMAIIESYKVNPDEKAKIIINERTGTIVAGGNVVLKEVAISHGNLTVEIKAEGEEAGAPQSLIHVEKGKNLNDLVKALNALGATPEDLIIIFQSLKKNGSLIGELEFI